MNRNIPIFSLLVLTLATLGGCSSQPSAEQSKPKVQLDKILGKAQVLPKSGGGADAALTVGESSVYLWLGMRRYRLFMRTAADVNQGTEYVVEGINAQKVIDEIGDPDQGTTGYPLLSSCARVVKMAWTNQAFDAIDAEAEVLRLAVKRYPARPVFLVTKIRPATAEENAAAAEERKKTSAVESEDVPEVSVPAEKQKASLLESPPPQTAPIWEPKGGTVRCKVVIAQDGKIADLESGTQLCEATQWNLFRFKPPVQNGKPVRVKTEVEVKYEPRK